METNLQLEGPTLYHGHFYGNSMGFNWILWEFYGIYTGILKLDFNGDLMGCNGIWQDFMGFKGL